MEEGKREQRDRETGHLRIKSFRKLLPTWTQTSLGLSGTNPPSQATPNVGVSTVVFPFPAQT